MTRANTYKDLIRYRTLINFMADRKRHASVFKTYLGNVWFLLEPLLHMLIYYLLLTVIFQAGPRYGVDPFIFIMLGLSHYFIFRRALTGCTNAINGYRNLLLQVKIDPLVFIAVQFKQVLMEFVTFALIFFAFFAYMGPEINWQNFMIYPFALAVLLITAWCAAIIGATLSVFLRDFKHMSTFIGRIMLYGSPILYSVDFVPEQYQNLYMYNPFATLFSLFHTAFFGSPLPEMKYIASMLTLLVIVFVATHAFYNHTKVKFTKVF